MTSEARSVRLPPLWLLVSISALGPIVLNGVLPANTQIMHDLATEYGVVQLVLTIYLVAVMLSQVIMGNLADSWGRRPVMIGNLVVFSIGSLICTFSASVEVLLIGRFIQGFGSSICMFLPRTIVRDVYGRDRSASLIGYMTTAMMAAPLFGPALGGWLTDVSSWRWMYGLLATLGMLLAVLAYLFQNETLSLENRDKRPIGSNLLRSSRALLKVPDFISYLCIQCGAVGVYYCFLGGAPYLMMELRGYSASVYGLWFMFIGTGYLLGNLAAGRFSERIGGDKMIRLSLLPGLVGVIMFWVLYQWQHPLGLFLPMHFVAFSNGVCIPNLMSAIMSVRPEMAGSASGLAGTMQTAMGILFTSLLSLFLVQTPLPVYVLITLSASLCFLGYVRLFHCRRY